MNEIEISQIQKQFWILQNVYRDNTAYNIPVILKIKGIPDIDAMEYSINRIIARHEILRTFFNVKNGEVYQTLINPDEAKVNVDVVEMNKYLQDNILPEEIMEEVHRVFNLNEWQLVHIKLFMFSDEISLLSIVFHHIVVDLHSKLVFSEEFREIYNSFRKNQFDRHAQSGALVPHQGRPPPV